MLKKSCASFLPLSDVRRKHIPQDSLKLAKIKDFLWITDLEVHSNTHVPMWVGWNAMSTALPKTPIQKVWYLPQINQSPTSNAVVRETMKRSVQLASECAKPAIAVTYDLAIAKIAMRIQENESPTFDMLFIALGAFHVILAFFVL